jgi:glycine cleavage system H protein
MSDIRNDLKYSKEHEWIRVEGNVGTIGISDFAQHELGEIVYIELPTVGDSFKAHAQFGTVESVKAASDLFIPVSGKVIEINHGVEDAPDTINSTPYDAWMIKVEMSDASELDQLMSAEAYKAHTS